MGVFFGEKDMMTYREAEAYIKRSYDQVIRLGLSRMKVLLDKLGNPQNSLKFIHVAGTNGKGSVCAMTAQILQCAGYQTGLFTSPVIFDYREQFQVNGALISKADFSRLAETVKQVCEQMSDPPSEFEKAVALAFLYFRECHCDLVVLEVGMGGTDDATNIIGTPQIAAIVNIDFDHMGFLGNTLAQIAEKKAGIIKEAGTVVTAEQKAEVMAVLEETCAAKHAVLIKTAASDLKVKEKNLDGQCFDYVKTTDRDIKGLQNVKLSLLGDHQCENAAVVFQIIECLNEKGYPISDEAIREGMGSVRWPGRFEVVSEDPLLIIDGAHNEDAAVQLAETVENCFTNTRLTYIIGVLADKEHEKMLEIMLPYAKRVYTVTPDNARALDAKSLAQEAAKYCTDVQDVGSVEQALVLALKDKEPVLAFVSLSYLGDLKRAFYQYKES